MPHAHLTGTGLYAPARVVPNAYFDALYGEDVSTALRTRRRIEARRYAADDESTSDLALHAAEAALADAGRTPDDVDLVLLTTDTPDYLSPATAAVVQHKLGAGRATAFDLNAACAGFVIALDTARAFVEAGRHGTVLVVSAYLMSRFLDYDVPAIAPLFADGAGAAVVEATDGPHHVLAAHTLTEGGYHGHMGVYAGGTAEPLATAGPPDDADGSTDSGAHGGSAHGGAHGGGSTDGSAHGGGSTRRRRRQRRARGGPGAEARVPAPLPARLQPAPLDAPRPRADGGRRGGT